MRRLARRLAPFAVVALLAPFAACATYEQELQRSEEHYQHDEHEKALANLRALEPEWTSFSSRDQARYCYLRGMTDLRLGFISDARHWLAVAQQIDKDHPGSLRDKERKATDDKLGALNVIVWAGDVLPIDEPPGDRRTKKPVRPSSSEADEPKGDDVAPKAKKKQGDDDDGDAPKAKRKKGDDEDSSSPTPKQPEKKGDE